MIRIAITAQAFEAMSATLPFGSVDYERTPEGGYFVWLDKATVDRLATLRGPGERLSDVIVRVAAPGRLQA